jgi:hypothetical protein
MLASRRSRISRLMRTGHGLAVRSGRSVSLSSSERADTFRWCIRTKPVGAAASRVALLLSRESACELNPARDLLRSPRREVEMAGAAWLLEAQRSSRTCTHIDHGGCCSRTRAATVSVMPPRQRKRVSSRPSPRTRSPQTRIGCLQPSASAVIEPVARAGASMLVPRWRRRRIARCSYRPERAAG